VSDDEQFESAFRLIMEALKVMPPEERVRFLMEIPGWGECPHGGLLNDPPVEAPPEDRPRVRFDNDGTPPPPCDVEGV